MLDGDVVEELKKPFDPDSVQWMIQRTSKKGDLGFAVPYYDRRKYEDRLDEALGADRWSAEYEIKNMKSITGAVVAKVTLKIYSADFDQTLRKVDFGESSAGDNQTNVVQTSVANGFKRACSTLGVGRYLYKCDEVMTSLYDNQNDSKTREYARVNVNGNWTGKYYDRPQLPDVAVPEGYERENKSQRNNSSQNRSSSSQTSQNSSEEESIMPSSANGSNESQGVPGVPGSGNTPTPSGSSNASNGNAPTPDEVQNGGIDFDRDENLGITDDYRNTAWKEIPHYMVDWIVSSDFDEGTKKEKGKKEYEHRLGSYRDAMNSIAENLNFPKESIASTLKHFANDQDTFGSADSASEMSDFRLDHISDLEEYLREKYQNSETVNWVKEGQVLDMKREVENNKGSGSNGSGQKQQQQDVPEVPNVG